MAREEIEFDIRKWADEHFIELVDKDVWADAKKALQAQADGDYISRQAVLDLLEDTNNGWIINEVSQLPSVKPQEPTGHCKDCKHFRKLPYHADAIGKCVHHWGFCPKGDWYCADYEPQERSDKE